MVVLCVRFSKLAATHLVCRSKLRCYKVPYGVLNACIVWILLRTPCSPVLISFVDGKILDFSPSSTQHSNYTKNYALYQPSPHAMNSESLAH